MMDDQVPEAQQPTVMQVADLFDHCCRAVEAMPTRATDYRPTAHQVFFFVLVGLVKLNIQVQHATDQLHDRDGVALSAYEIDDQIRRVVAHLGEWGDVVAGLKRCDAHEWELLRIQMEKSLRRYTGRESDNEDILQDALLKVWSGLGRLVDADALDDSEDIIALVTEHRTALTNVYDFSSPFYAYTGRIARNELVSRIRRDVRSPVLSTPIEELAEVLADPAPLVPDEDERTAIEQAQRHIRIDLQRLLNLVQACPPGQRQVVLATLAARPQFWRALEVAELPAPDGVTRPPGPVTDAELAHQLQMTENNIRVQRLHAKRRISSQNPTLGALLERLITTNSVQG